nr:hypothetical protein [uncultured Undibacterium sp.]
MIIRQHGSSGELFDMNTFLSDVDKFFQVDAWRVNIQDCLGEGASAIEEKIDKTVDFSDLEFRRIYQDVYQTIDGSFVALFREVEQCRLEVFDSSYWEVSGSPEFEHHMQSTYGEYRCGG